MGNLNYKRSRARELKIKNDLEKEGYYTIRAAGSKGLADVIAIKPANCKNSHYIVRFIQVKVSEKLRNEKIVFKKEKAPFGMINTEYHKFPVKTKKWHAHTKKLKSKKRV